jgi:hypothetical protein
LVDLKVVFEKGLDFEALANLAAQDVSEVGGLAKVVLGHESEVEEARGLKPGRRVSAGVGSLVDPLDKVAALVVGKEPNGTGTGNVELGLGHGVVDAVPNEGARRRAVGGLAGQGGAVVDDSPVVGFVDDDAEDGRVNGDLVVGEPALGDELVGTSGVFKGERVAGHVDDALGVDDVAELEAGGSGLLRVRVKVADRHGSLLGAVCM